MFLLGTANPRFNSGDVIFQLIMFVILVAIPIGIFVFYKSVISRNKRLKRVEAKLDKLLAESEKNHKNEVNKYE